MSQSTERLSGSMWSKVYRRTLILPHQMVVNQRLFMGEDAACILPVYRDAASIYISHKTAYYYRTRSGSMTHSFQPAQLESVRLLFQAIEKLDGVPGFDEQIDRFALYTGAYIMERTIYSQTNRDQYQTMVWDFFMQPNRFCRLRRARFTAGTPKMLGAFFLIRHRRKKLTFAYLSACMYLKSLGLKELLIRLAFFLINFVVRRVFTQTLTQEYLGLNGLFADILNMLSLAELGFGGSILFSLYKPVAEGDTGKIKSLMQLYRKAYHIIAVVVLTAGLSLTPFLDFFVREMPDIPHIEWIFILNIINSAVSYLFIYKSSLLYAYQKQYIQTIIATAVGLVTGLVRIAVLVLTQCWC